MTCRNNKLFSILLFALGIFLSNLPPAQAQQACQPALYLFRHAEDESGRVALTSVGKTHANLYPAMITQLQETFTPKLCPVKRVFAMWDRNGAGTTNPYETARPLAQAVNPGYVPEMFFVNGTGGTTHKYYLCEYIHDDTAPFGCELEANYDRNALFKYDADVNSRLYSYLSAYLQSEDIRGSVAIFHTSQGIPGVSTALGVNPVVVTCDTRVCTQKLPPTGDCPLPDSKSNREASCYKNEDPLLSWPGIQRSSVQIFFYSNSGGNFVKQYNPINTKLSKNDNLLKVLQFQQCYNFNNSSQALTSGKYYCQYSGILGNGVASTDTTIGKNGVKLADIKGKICKAPNIVANPQTVADSFGYCLD